MVQDVPMPTATIKLARIFAAMSAAMFAATVVAVPVLPGTAWAHTQLLATNPTDKSTVDTPVTTVALTFNQPVKQQFSTVVVRGADTKSYSDGTPRAVDQNLTQAVQPLPGGQITVSWRVVSQDGDPVQGQFTFTNTASSAATAPSPTSPAAVPSHAGTSKTGGGASGWYVAASIAALVAVTAAAFVVWRRRRRGEPA
jgi:methionine-rich copper-binding protein CopC